MSDYCLPGRAEKEFSWPFSMFIVSHAVFLIDEDFFLMLQMIEQFMSFLSILAGVFYLSIRKSLRHSEVNKLYIL